MFTANQVTEAKRAAQREMYALVASYGRTNSVLSLAGESFWGEHDIIRDTLPNAFILAVDRDRRAQSGVPAGVPFYCGDIRNIPYTHDLVHLDLCANLTPATHNLIRDAAAKANRWLAVCISYGREPRKRGGAETRIQELCALVQLWYVKAWQYTGNAMPMLLVLFSRRRLFTQKVTRIKTTADSVTQKQRRGTARQDRARASRQHARLSGTRKRRHA